MIRWSSPGTLIWLVRPRFLPATSRALSQCRPKAGQDDERQQPPGRSRPRRAGSRDRRRGAEQREGRREGRRGLDARPLPRRRPRRRAPRRRASRRRRASPAASRAPSLWGPPTTWTRTSGLRPTKAAARSGSTPRAGARRATSSGQGERRERRDQLQHQHRGADRDPGQRVGAEREERPVDAGRAGPVDFGEGRVPRRRRGRVDVGVETVGDAQVGVVDVAVDVVGEQRRQQGEDHDQREDRAPDQAACRAPARIARTREVGEEAGPDQGEGRPAAEAQLAAPGACRRRAAADPGIARRSAGAGEGGGLGGTYGSCPTPGA